ncbi:MAG: ammonium transporter [Jatrophihabitantaceae bacterium]
MPDLDTGNTAWMLVSAALVLLMTPGLAFFYGGMVRSKSVLNMLMMSFICLATVPVLWVIFGYAFAFGTARGNIIGWNNNLVGLGSHSAVLRAVNSAGVPVLVFAAFQLMFAVITPALVSGAIADRLKFWGWTTFVLVWVTLVYFPVANWVFGSGWILNKLHVEDFAGGTAVHINAGSAALALALVAGKRIGWRRDPMKPHNVPFVLLGASLLWFGWFGFNAGSEGAADGVAALAFMTTGVATATGILGWLAVEQFRDGRPTTVGAASGAVAGLVAITPACAFVSPLGGAAIGLIAGVLCALAVGLKYRFGFDDSLDVVGVHLVGGVVGTLLIGVFGFDGGAAALGYVDAKGNPIFQRGLLYGGDFSLLGKQALAVVCVFAYSFSVAFLIGTVLKKVGAFRVSAEVEVAGIDEYEHAETAYSFSSVLGGGLTSAGTHPSPQAAEPAVPVAAGKGI